MNELHSNYPEGQLPSNQLHYSSEGLEELDYGNRNELELTFSDKLIHSQTLHPLPQTNFPYPTRDRNNYNCVSAPPEQHYQPIAFDNCTLLFSAFTL